MTLFARPGGVAQTSGDNPPEPGAPAPKRPPGWSVANWPVRWKVIAIALVPMVLAMVFAGLRISGALADADRMQQAADRAELVPAITDYMSALNGVLVAASAGGDVQSANRRYENRKYQLQSRSADAAVASDVQSGVTTLIEGGQGLLNQVLADSIGLRDQVTGYAPILLTAEDAINGSVRVDNERIRAETEGLSRAVGARGQMMMQELLVNRGGELADPELRTSMITLAGTEPSTLFGISQVLGVDTPDAKQLQQQMVTRMAIMSDPEAVLPNNPALRDSMRSTDQIAARVVDDTTRSVTTWLADQATERRNAAIRDTALMLAAVLLALAAVWLVARSLVRPLRTLRDSALKVAHTDLENEIARARAGDEREPTPLPVYTSEEVGQVAHAVDELHTQALLLAGDEARLRRLVNEMFETMSRRNRSLVDQQLSLIDRLERDESDPDRLDNLFRLDHLAVRMRRNGANLLVLAGARVSQDRTRSAALSTVISAAISEVEEYRRVQTGTVPDVAVIGAAVGDTVHLVAELIDNALGYSPPTTQVRVSAVPTAQAGVLIQIVDSGLGMTDTDLRITNMRLGAGGEATPENARHMGLFVVSRLAQRHGIGVRLAAASQAPGRGISAEVHLPPDLLAGVGADQPAPRRVTAAAPPRGGQRGSRERAPAAVAAQRNGFAQHEPAIAALPRRRPGTGGSARLAGGEAKLGPPHQPSGIADAASETPPEPPPVAPEEDLIYQRMLSEWLVDPHELGRSTDLDWKSVWDHGWSVAAEVERVPVDAHTEHGLPVREPGVRLVPGSAPPSAGEARHRADPERDPDAVRASISSHFGGVRAGRSHARAANGETPPGPDQR